jgi:hypothetical protein
MESGKRTFDKALSWTLKLEAAKATTKPLAKLGGKGWSILGTIVIRECNRTGQPI